MVGYRNVYDIVRSLWKHKAVLTHEPEITNLVELLDAQYFLVKNDVDIILWVNEHLVKAIQWQEDPAIAHDQVKLGGELSIFYPTWADEIVIPNNCTKEELFKLCDKENK